MGGHLKTAGLVPVKVVDLCNDTQLQVGEHLFFNVAVKARL